MKTIKDMLGELEKKYFAYTYQSIPGVDEQTWLKLLFSSYPFDILAFPIKEDRNLRKKFRLNPSPKVVSKSHLVKFVAKEFPKNISMWEFYSRSWFTAIREYLEPLQEMSDEEIKEELEDEQLILLLSYVFFCQREGLFEYFREKLPETLKDEAFQELFGKDEHNDVAGSEDKSKITEERKDTNSNDISSGFQEALTEIMYEQTDLAAAKIIDVLGTQICTHKDMESKLNQLLEKNEELRVKLKSKKGELKAKEVDLKDALKELKQSSQKERELLKKIEDLEKHTKSLDEKYKKEIELKEIQTDIEIKLAREETKSIREKNGDLLKKVDELEKQNKLLIAQSETIADQGNDSRDEFAKLQKLLKSYGEDLLGMTSRVRQLEKELENEKNKRQDLTRKNIYSEVTGKTKMSTNGISAENISKLLDRVKQA